MNLMLGILLLVSPRHLSDCASKHSCPAPISYLPKSRNQATTKINQTAVTRVQNLPEQVTLVLIYYAYVVLVNVKIYYIWNFYSIQKVT